MAKRHQSLISLSHDHHHGLALAIRLQQGDRALLADGWTHDRGQQVEKVMRFYDEELSIHFRLEEEILFPVIGQYATDSATLIKTLVAEHRRMEALIGQLRSPRDVAPDQTLVNLGTILELHIRAEERELFQEYERWIPEQIASDVGESLGRMRDSLVASRQQRTNT